MLRELGKNRTDSNYEQWEKRVQMKSNANPGNAGSWRL